MVATEKLVIIFVSMFSRGLTSITHMLKTYLVTFFMASTGIPFLWFRCARSRSKNLQSLAVCDRLIVINRRNLSSFII